MAIKVFVSYASQDKELAENVKHELATRGHLPDDAVFFDAQDIAVGEDIRQRLRSGDRGSGCCCPGDVQKCRGISMDQL